VLNVFNIAKSRHPTQQLYCRTHEGTPGRYAPLEITFLTQDEVRWLFAVTTGKRDRALFQLAYHHGL
jgi:hypothetical protein